MERRAVRRVDRRVELRGGRLVQKAPHASARAVYDDCRRPAVVHGHNRVAECRGNGWAIGSVDRDADDGAGTSLPRHLAHAHRRLLQRVPRPCEDEHQPCAACRQGLGGCAPDARGAAGHHGTGAENGGRATLPAVAGHVDNRCTAEKTCDERVLVQPQQLRGAGRDAFGFLPGHQNHGKEEKKKKKKKKKKAAGFHSFKKSSFILKMSCPVDHKKSGGGECPVDHSATEKTEKTTGQFMPAPLEPAAITGDGPEPIAETPSDAEYRRIRKTVGLMVKFYEGGADKKKQQFDAAQAELDKLSYIFPTLFFSSIL
eukprot:TRINITY_DN2257_c0_g1_i5.p1 TRINITY_DN2257_c0_g1~~TRINITY_DN2257_c0_g1_i5.p1  ORF type:complete len:314 (+),score=90.68 TRINITY_DN2257_c0_g1_i5:309-1250(+)